MTSTSTHKPAWAGDDWLSRLVNQLIATPLLYRLMKQQARRVLIKTAEKKRRSLARSRRRTGY